MIPSTLFALATNPFRRFVMLQSETNWFATSAKWLAGRACNPLGSEQENSYCNEGLDLCVISPLDLEKNILWILQRFLQRDLNDFHAMESLPFFDLNIDRKDRDMRLPNIALRKFVLDSHSTLRFHLDVVAEVLRNLFQSRCRHVRVRNS